MNAQVYLTENFDASIPATWTITDAGGATGDSWVSGLQGGTNSLNGSNVAVVDSDADGNGTLLLETLTSPVFDTTGATNLFLEFDQFYRNGGGDRAIVEVFDGTNWVEVLNQSATTGAFNAPNEQAINITDFSNANMQIRFVYNDNNVWAWYWLIDNVVVSNLLCAEPTAVTLTNITSDGVQVNWSPGGTETAWNVVVQPAGTGVPTTGSSQTSPYIVTGLNPSSPYEVYIQSACGGTDGNSTWAGPFNFNTLNVPPPPPVGVTCASGASSTVFTETFGTVSGAAPAGWTGTGFGGANGNWRITNPGANSGGTGPNITYDGNPGVHLEYEASGNSSAIANAISPAIDLSTAVDGAELAFFMHAFGDDMGTLNVGVGTSPTGPFTTEYSWVGDYQATATEAWAPIGVDLSAYLGQVIYIQFSYGGAGTGFEGDMSIDHITVETCGTFCIAPSSLTVANVGGQSADISWVGNNGETSWNYVVQPAGTGVPANGAGTNVTIPNVNEAGLNFSTPYEVYVQANCTNGMTSLWAGPVNFTTTVQTNFTVDCSVGPTNFNYCYGNNDSNVFTFTSSDGSALVFTINSGNVENNFDELVVFDSDGTTDLNIATPYGAGGNVGGITYQSSGDTISFTVNSDGSINCGSSATINPLDITVACATCINPTATYTIIDDCANGNQFLVDVNVTSLGDATSVSVEDNQGSPVVTGITATGVQQLGPFPFATDIIITIRNEQDVNCVIQSNVLRLEACPPDNDNCVDAIVAAVNNDDTCSLTTPGTLVEATASPQADPSCGVNDADDDVWFQFTALNESTLISLQNAPAFGVEFAVYSGTCGALTEIACNPDGDLALPVSLIINEVYYVRVYSSGSSSSTATFNLCIRQSPLGTLCETAGTFCDNNGTQTAPNNVNLAGLGEIACLFSTPNPSWNVLEIAGNGLVEVEINQIDNNGNGIDVDFVLWGPFASGTDFCADGVLDQGCPQAGDCPNNTTNPNFYPFGNIVDCSYSFASIENFTIPNAMDGEVYILLVTNFSNDPGDITITQTNAGTPGSGTVVASLEVELLSDLGTIEDDDMDPMTPSTLTLCGETEVTFTADETRADRFEWSVAGIQDLSATTNTFVVTAQDLINNTGTTSGEVTVTAFDDDCGVTDSFTVLLSFYNSPVSVALQDLQKCDDPTLDGVELFDLESQTPIITGAQATGTFTVTYYDTLANAESGTGALTSPYSATDGTTIFVRVEDSNANGVNTGCELTTMSFNLVIPGAAPVIVTQNLELCDDVSNDGFESFDLDAEIPNILNGADPALYNVTFHETLAAAMDNQNPLTSPYTNLSNNQPIFVRAEDVNSADCFVTDSFTLTVIPVPEIVVDNSINYEICPNTTQPISIVTSLSNYNENDVSITWEFNGSVISGANNLTYDNVLTAGIYTITVVENNLQCTSLESVEVFESQSCVIPQGISPNNDGLNDTFDLTSFDVQSIEIFNRNGIKVYVKSDGYTNEWRGQSKDGDELPTGTYYYIIRYQNGKEKASWVYINR